MEEMSEYRPILDDLIVQLRQDPGELQSFLDSVTAADSTLSELDQAKEVVARVAEGGTSTSLYGRLRAATRSVLRKWGFARKFEENDIRALISKAARRYGDGSTIKAPTVFHVEQNEVIGARSDPEDPYTVTLGEDENRFFGRVWADEELQGSLLTHVPSATVVDGQLVFDTSDLAGLELWVNSVAESDMQVPQSLIESSFMSGIQPADTRYKFSKRGSISEEFEVVAENVSEMPAEDQTIGYRVRRLLNRVKAYDLVGDIRQGLVDGFWSIERLERAESDGELRSAADSAYKAAIATKNVSSQIAAMFRFGALKYNDEGGSFDLVEGRQGVEEIFGKLKDKSGKSLLYNWEIWAAAQRASRLIQEKNPDGTNREKNFTQEQIDIVNREVAASEYADLFQTVFDEYQTFNNQMLDEAVRIGAMNSDMREAWRTNDYVPFYRAMEVLESDTFKGTDPGTVAKAGSGKSLDGKSVRSQRLTGGQEALSGRMFEHIMMNAAYIQDTMNKHIAMKRLVDMGSIVLRKVPMATAPQHFTNAQLAAPLIEAGLIDSEAEVANMTPAQQQQWQTLFATVAPRADNIVSVMEDGKMSYYEVHDPLLMRSIKAIGTDNFDTFLMRMFGAPKKLLTAAVTADPAFMVANFARDTLASFVVSNRKMVPFASSMKGFMEALQGDPLLFRIMAAGGGGGGFYNQADIRELIAQKVPGNKVNEFMKSIIAPNSSNGLWQMLQKVGNASEMANRIAIANDVLKAGEGLGEASYHAQDLLNFTMHGDWAAMRFLTNAVPFMNARVQGLYRLYRGGRDNPTSFALKGMAIMAASLALWFKNKDDDRYQELNEWDKDAYWHMFVGDKHYRFPKPFEVGAIFGTIPERVMQQVYDKEDGRIFGDRFLAMWLDTFAMNPIPQAVKPILEQYSNRNFFTGYPIIGMGDRSRPLEMQYSHMTSETFRELARAMPDIAPSWLRSPKRLEALWRGYTGAMGMYALSAADGITQDLAGYPDRPTMKVWDRPIAKRFIRDPRPFSNKYQTQLYDMLTEANQLNRAIKDLQELGEGREAARIKRESRSKLATRKRLSSISRRVAKINKRIRRIYTNPRMSGDKKWEAINRLKTSKIKILRQVEQYADKF
jgi:hypothetical protein